MSILFVMIFYLKHCFSTYSLCTVVEKHCKVEKTSTSLVIGNTTITLETKKSNLTKANAELDDPIKCDDAELSDRDEAEGDDSEFEDSDENVENEEATAEKQKKTKEAIKQ